MEIIQEILKDLKFEPENFDEGSIEETYIYKFIAARLNITNHTYDYFKRIAVKAISCELYRQDNYGVSHFEEEAIYDLLLDRNDDEYKDIFEYIFGKITYLEHHNINKVDTFFSENFKIEYHLLINIFAKIITSDLNVTLEKVKKNLSATVTVVEWSDLILSGNGEYLEVEIERMKQIINGVLG